MIVRTTRRHVALLMMTALACGRVDDPTLNATDDPRFEAPAPPARQVGHSPTRNVFWGDLHIHSAYSMDAYTMGVRALPEDAYNFAKGGTITHGVGYPIRLSRPLDFAAVTDHSEFLGAARSVGESAATEPSLRDVLATGSPLRITYNYFRVVLTKMSSSEKRLETFGGMSNQAASDDAWRDIIETAERHNQPGRFTSFIAYEWTSMPDEENLHRNVIYGSSAVPAQPYSALDSENPEDLWKQLDAERARGMPVIAIPHNANVSNGRMYARAKFAGEPIDAEYAAQRMHNEPISEILQVKGQSEVHPLLASEDEFANFELFDILLSSSGAPSEPTGSYSRDALKTGLELARQHAFNPYRFGVIGSSDSHNASSSVEEDQYHGKLPLLDGTAGLRLGEVLLLPDSQNRALRWSAAGLAAVWAEENTRKELFDAMRRKETYASSGPRISVRFFGGFDFATSILEEPNFLELAYAGGVPMGGDLPCQGAATPRFVVMALKDPLGANLDRIQIIKGWVDATGVAQERIYDVVASDNRRADAVSGRVGPVGNTVDVANASYTNSIGAERLDAVWEDLEFDAAIEAFYYARVLEIPTPRWSTYDAKALGVEAPEPTSLQERAITSAIWLRP